MISIETSVPQQAPGFIIKCISGISNIAACRWKMLFNGSFSNNQRPIMFHFAKTCIFIGFPITISKL